MSIRRNVRVSFLLNDSESSFELQQSRSPSPFREPTKYIERRIIRAWKTFTRTTRRAPRNSVLPEGFVLMTSKRRSIMMGSRPRAAPRV
ncbi:hypothetical protein BJ322DRAFT_406575 [Thelephora terrestris]|uniref:Uncharacterized protein n=1 Tax=Thelephora terrestris TaxID=56493 RepID=A0A9P6HMX1_9AGAM|nr:hypothetical protein BJ322DRAFT_406575 [Thelephora terrestris]